MKFYIKTGYIFVLWKLRRGKRGVWRGEGGGVEKKLEDRRVGKKKMLSDVIFLPTRACLGNKHGWNALRFVPMGEMEEGLWFCIGPLLSGFYRLCLASDWRYYFLRLFS